MKHSPANRPMNSRDQLYSEIISRFDQELFRKSEDVDGQTKGAIWIDNIILSETETGILHPDIAILLDKYEAWIEKIDIGSIIHVPLCEKPKVIKQKSFGNFALKNLKLVDNF